MNPEETLVVIAYQHDSAAQAARERLLGLSAEDLITIEVAAILIKDMKGKVNVHRPHTHRGLRHIFGGSDDPAGLDDQIVRTSSQALDAGQAALCLLVRSVAPEKVVPELSRYGGTVVMTSLPPDREQLLKEAFAQQFTSEQIAAELNR